MEGFVARQPIYTAMKDIYAYELLYRNNLDNRFPEIDGDAATTDVIINSFINIGIDDLSNGKPCFINFTENLLQQKLPTYFKPKEVVVEILETVELSQELLEICQDLKSKGYQLALDDFILNGDNPYTYPMLELASIVKVDFRNTTAHMRQKIEELQHKYNLKLLAEKIETKEEFEAAVSLGYVYFQGYYFSKPVILSTQVLPENLQNYLILMNHLSTSEPDLNFITQIIEQDVSLSFKLIKLINSPAYHPKSKINSIKQAIIRLGFNELRKWIYILLIRGNLMGKSEWDKEMFTNSLIRAKMCELIALHKNKRAESSSYFLTGLFSLMDVMLSMEMGQILKLMPLHEDICEALNGKANQMKDSLDLIISIEKGDWQDVFFLSDKLQIEEKIARNYFNEAFKWANNLIKN
jgi:EAL and modified HD-GYP domain-containing signal transduction protein